MVGVRYDHSPFGPYLELSVAEPARLGLRPGLCVTTMALTSADVRAACRPLWGLSAELGTLRWSDEGDERALTWVERGVTIRGRPWGPGLPAAVPVGSVQRRSDGPVLAPRRFRARVRLAGTAVTVPEGDQLAWLDGPHPGALMTGVRVVAFPARRPTGLLSTLRVPLRAPDPAGGAATMALPGRMAQLVRAQPSHG